MSLYEYSDSAVLEQLELQSVENSCIGIGNTAVEDSINAALKTIHPISLEEIDQIKLMSRIDAKYAFPLSRLPELLALASKQYRVLEICGQKAMDYSSIYMDTNDMLLYHQHLCGKANRFKVRYRTYETTKESFLEVKCTTSKKRTEKTRIKSRLENGQPDKQAMDFLCKHLQSAAEDLIPFFTNKFKRITLAGLDSKERITLDFNLQFSGYDGTKTELPFLAIAEVKKEGYSASSPFMRLLKQMQIRPTGFSKYCIGNALLRKMPKENILKPKLLMLQKIYNENSVYAIA